MAPNLRSLTVLLALLSSPAAATATSYYLCTDVPATLGGIDYRPNELLMSADGAYSVEFDFADIASPGLQIGGLERRPDGMWVLSPANPEEGVGPRDVVLFNGLGSSTYFDGNAAGVPEYARIDAILLDAGSLVLSFDVPVGLAGTEYGPSDLVRWDAPGFSPYWDAEAAGVPAGSNVVGASRDPGGSLVLTFDVPTSLGGTDYLPGELVQWNGGTSFVSVFMDPAWPRSAQLRDFGFLPPAGEVPDGDSVPGLPLTISRAAGDLTLSWGDGCPSPASDYEIYEGDLTAPFTYTHAAKLCTTGGATSATFPEPTGNAYYLVIERNAVTEGSYGRASNGAERPQGSAACLAQQIGAACP